MTRYSSQFTDDSTGVARPIAGAKVYVYASLTGALATLKADDGSALANPLTTDSYGNFLFNADPARYDLQYIVGGKKVFQEDGVPVGVDIIGQAVAASTAAVLALSFTVTSASGQTVTTRGLLASIASPVNGQVARLNEAGREGVFTFSTANLSTNVTADPYQGLYVAPASATSGASGAWVRVVTDNEYHLSWWNPTQLGNNGHTVLNSVAALLPAGSTLAWGKNVVTVAGPVTFYNAVHILGIGSNASRLEAATGSEGALGTQGMLRIRASHSSVRRMGFKGIETGYFANNPPCILCQIAYTLPATIAQRTLEDVEISECEIENTSLGVALAGAYETDGAVNSGQVITPSKNIRVHHNIITTNQHGVEIFGSDNCDAHDNQIFPTPGTPAAQFSAPFRILGSAEVWVHDNHITGNGQDGNGRCAFRMSAAGFGTGVRRANNNVRIRNNDVKNVWTFCQIDEAQGDLIVEGNSWTDPLTSTVQTVAYHFDAYAVADGLGNQVGRFYAINNRLEGVAKYVLYDGLPVKYMECVGDTVIGNAASITGPGRLLNSAFTSIKYAVFDKVRWIMSDGGGTGFSYKNAAGCTLKVVNCVLPEQANGTAMLDGDGTGTFIKTLGNSGEDATFGANSKHAAGTFALVQ